MAQNRAKEHLEENYYSEGHDNNPRNFNYCETTNECMQMVEKDTMIEVRNAFILLLQTESQLSGKAIRMIEEKFNEKYDL